MKKTIDLGKFAYSSKWLVWPLPYEIINIINALLK